MNKWLQLGGHADGDDQIHRVALRESQEESGIQRIAYTALTPHCVVVSEKPSPIPLPIDLDVHTIPARYDEPEHEHFDVSYLLVALDNQLILSEESHELRWFEWDEIHQLDLDLSVKRQMAKAFAVKDLPKERLYQL
jgi:8-oxo-dGTP pyrophosphatase MutT (NUDIX family)